MKIPVFALTQGDPAGVGPELLLAILADESVHRSWRPLLVAERAVLESLREVLPEAPWPRLRFFDRPPPARRLEEVFAAGDVAVVDPVADGPAPRPVTPGRPRAADAAGALAALDAGVELARRGLADALVTLPLNKAAIARHLLPDFRGHTGYLAAAAGLERYGRDYLMTFLSDDLRVALLTAHMPLADALAAVSGEAVLEALECLHRHAGPGPRIAVAGINPHAGEGGLLGSEDDARIRPAVAAARGQGIDAHGPESADSLFARARRGEFDWVLALYHDQGLIAVKTAAFGAAVNWTLGLPFLRTSVDHGTAYGLAGTGRADAGPLRYVIARTESLVKGFRRRGPAV